MIDARLKRFLQLIAALCFVASPLKSYAWSQAYVVGNGFEEPGDGNGAYARNSPNGSPGQLVMGRIYNGQHVHVDSFSPSGEWAWGFVHGNVQACRWVRTSSLVFTGNTGSGNRCPTNRDIAASNGEVWGLGTTTGQLFQVPRATHMWDNWLFGQAWGNHNYRGIAPAGSWFKIRYTTTDGAGVMAQRCAPDLSDCYSDWVFIERASLDPPPSWSHSGAVPGMHCVAVNEPADPHGWDNNYLCSGYDVGLRWSYAGPIAGMYCTNFNEPGDPYAWSDNYLCSRYPGIAFSYDGPIAGRTCVQTGEPADPHYWHDNYLCF